MTTGELIQIRKLHFHVYEKMINPRRCNWTKCVSAPLHNCGKD